MFNSSTCTINRRPATLLVTDISYENTVFEYYAAQQAELRVNDKIRIQSEILPLET